MTGYRRKDRRKRNVEIREEPNTNLVREKSTFTNDSGYNTSIE